jgi:hypothetical protein
LEEESQAVSETTTAERAPVAPKEPPKGLIRGNIKYPWGVVKEAKVVIGEKSVLSDNEGTYEVKALEAGSHSILVQPPFPGYETPAQTAELKEGETKVVDIYLDFKKTVVDGRVYSQEGKPITGATLSGVLSGKDMDSVTTDKDGHFRFDRVTPGDRFIRVNAPGYVGETRDFTAPEKQTTNLEFHLTPAACKVHGYITDTAGNPLEAEVLLLNRGTVVQKTISNTENGYYEFPASPDRYEVLPMAQGYTPKGWSGAVEADTKADFKLDRAPEVTQEQRQE